MLELWCICDHPADYPEHVVARQWLIESGEKPAPGVVILGPNLQVVRSMLPIGLTRMPRMPEDDPVIVESWL